MAHTTLKTSYSELADRLNRFPQGAPPSDLLFNILSMLFSEEEAGLVALMPIKPFTARKASRIWKKSLAETQKILDELASRAILVDIEQDGETAVYALPPPMAGFFEFSLMRVREDIDQKAAERTVLSVYECGRGFYPGIVYPRRNAAGTNLCSRTGIVPRKRPARTGL